MFGVGGGVIFLIGMDFCFFCILWLLCCLCEKGCIYECVGVVFVKIF